MMARYSVRLVETVTRHLEVTVEAATIADALRDALDGIRKDCLVITELPSLTPRAVFSIDTIEEDQ